MGTEVYPTDAQPSLLTPSALISRRYVRIQVYDLHPSGFRDRSGRRCFDLGCNALTLITCKITGSLRVRPDCDQTFCVWASGSRERHR
jgi:hypothetical protein